MFNFSKFKNAEQFLTESGLTPEEAIIFLYQKLEEKEKT